MTSIYESDIFAALPEMSMHPGGLRLTDRAARLAGLQPDMAAADIGCGAGATAAFLTRTYGLRVTGLDSSKALIEKGRQSHPDLDLVHWSGSALPFEGGSLDVVFLECSLSVIGSAGDILSECARTLQSAGILIISDVVSKQDGGGLPTVNTLAGRIERAGFDIMRLEDHTPALKAFVSSLYELDNDFDACAFFGDGCLKARPRLSDLGYVLIIARKI